jgi:hypothetical protein
MFIGIHVYLHLVGRILNAVTLVEVRHAHAFQIILEVHQIVDLSVLLIQNVQVTKHVCVKNVVTHAQALVVIRQFAEFLIMYQCVHVLMATLAILSQAAHLDHKKVHNYVEYYILNSKIID